MIAEAKDLARAWAQFIDDCRRVPRTPERLRQIHREEANVCVLPEAEAILRHGMAALDFDLFVTALIHYREPGSARSKVLMIQRLTGEPMSTRDLWNKLDRVHHFVAGISFERDVGVHCAPRRTGSSP